MQADEDPSHVLKPDTAALEFLRSTLPYRLVTTDGRVVGCWYTCNPCPSPEWARDGATSTTSVVYRGMVRTSDGRVSGIGGSMPLTPGFPARMLRMLHEAGWNESVGHRQRSSHDFVEGIGDAVERVRSASEGSHDDGDLRWPTSGDGRLASLPEAGVRDASAAFASERARCVRRFLDTLDPVMVDAVRLHGSAVRGSHKVDVMLGEAWPHLDRTFGAGAPLQARVLAAITAPMRLRRILRPHCERTYEHMESVAGRMAALQALRMPSLLTDEWPELDEPLPPCPR